MPYNKVDMWPYVLIEAAVEQASSTAISRYLPNHTVEISYKDSKCSSTNAPLAAIDLYIEKAADVFIGPVCEYALAPVARLAPTWGIPVISPGAFVVNFGDKVEYGTLTRMSGTYDNLRSVFMETIKFFKWVNVGVVYDHDANDCYFKMEGIHDSLTKLMNKSPWTKRIDEKKKKIDFAELLGELTLHSRSKISYDQ